jgi:lactoylglutathione lyase
MHTQFIAKARRGKLSGRDAAHRKTKLATVPEEDVLAETRGINHLGLTVRDLEASTSCFVGALGWIESARDDSYPRTTVTDGLTRFTLWQVDHRLPVEQFDRRKNVGLHHVALEVESEEGLNSLALTISKWPNVKIEFMPELLGQGPRKHMMLFEPGGNRIELIWPGV